VRHFHDRTVSALADMLAAAGLSHPDELRPHHVSHRVSSTEVRQFDQVHHYLTPNELIAGTCKHDYFRHNWAKARADSFDPAPNASGQQIPHDPQHIAPAPA
jgi:hypothetical protein